MAKQVVKLDGKRQEFDFDREAGPLTPEMLITEFKKRGAIPEGRRAMVKENSESRPLDSLPRDHRFSQEIDIKTIPGGTIKGALGRREQFIAAHVASVAEILGERYGQTVQLDAAYRFVVLPAFRLPRRWDLKTTPILIWFPKTYPDVPPQGFYLSSQCRGPHIYRYNVHVGTDGGDLSQQGWYWYCVHPTGWKASADPNQPDNLWTLLDVIRATLTIDEF